MILKKYAIGALVGLYILLGITYSIVTPIMEASDELWHYPMVKYIADKGRLPVQDPTAPETPWRQEGSQAPLYYAFNALLTAWIDTSDLPLARYPNPHADNGIITEDGNVNLMIHGLVDGFPWHGTALAIHLIRFVSVIMGAGTVYFTYLLVLELWPDRRGLALAAAAITAFNPMFIFISASVNNGNLGMLLSALAIWLLVRLVRQHDCPAGEAPSSKIWWRDVAILGLVLGAAVLTRTNTMGLLPLTALAITWIAWRRRAWWLFISGGAVTAGLVGALSGWWFIRNILLYDGDWTGIERFIAILGYRDPPATVRQLWGERHGFMMAYWGLFGGVNVPMPTWIYRLFNWIAVAAAVGLVLGLARRLVSLRRHMLFVPKAIPNALDESASSSMHRFWLGELLAFLWPMLVLLLWALWARRTWSSQGRLVFGALSAWSTWMAFGLSCWGDLLSATWQRLFGRARFVSSLVPGLIGVFMFAIALWVPFAIIAPTYRPPLLARDVEPQPQYPLQADVGGLVRLLGYDLQIDSGSSALSLQPGQSLRFTLYWETQRTMDRDWSVFCHVLDTDLGLPIATRDRFPGQGLLAATQLAPGTRWSDTYVVELPITTYAPTDALIEIGLYDRHTGERPPVLVESGEAEVVGNALRFQPFQIQPRPGDLPNPVHINFEDRLALVGWALEPRQGAPGASLQLTLYWQCLEAIDSTFTVSSQILAAGGLKVAQWDSWPGDSDTARWQVGQQVVDRRTLDLSPDAPAGGYELRLLIYDGATMTRMRIINDQGRVLPNDFHILGQVNIR